MSDSSSPDQRRVARRQRWRLLSEVSAWLDKPMTVLAFLWLALLVVDFTRGLTPSLETASYGIWILFGLHFILEFVIAPDKTRYLRRNWLTAVSLLLPAFRIFRAVRVFRALRLARAARPVGLLRLVTSLNRGMRATRKALGRHGVGYAMVLTGIITIVGAAGMFRFESPQALREAGAGEVAERGGGLRGYGEALWWTAMVMTTMGSEYWPQTTEGRILGWLLAVYAFAIFGYITATIASLFLGRRQAEEKPAPGTADLSALQQELAALKAEVARVTSVLDRAYPPEP